MQRVTDPAVCREVTSLYPDYFTFELESWIANSDNYVLMSGKNLAFAEYKQKGVYWVHFCFDTARGAEAVSLTQEMVETFCKAKTVRSLVGLISVLNRPAKWVVRQAGFKSLGVVDTAIGLCEMFYLNKGAIS